jgi:hypothetical protein
MLEFDPGLGFNGYMAKEIVMRQKKAKLVQNAKRAAALLEEHFTALSDAEEEKGRKALHELANQVSRRARERASRFQQSGASRPSRRSRAKTA